MQKRFSSDIRHPAFIVQTHLVHRIWWLAERKGVLLFFLQSAPRSNITGQLPGGPFTFICVQRTHCNTVSN
jgi:hypothetical protein